MKRKSTARDAQFDGFAVPEPKGDWKYELDDSGITYGKGLWPFYLTREGRIFHASVRLAPDSEYQAWRNQYVMLMPLWAEEEHYGKAPKVHVSIGVYTRPEGLGGWVSKVQAIIHIKKLRWQWTQPLSATIARQAKLKRRKVLQFIRRSLRERDEGRKAPLTAHERYTAAQAASRAERSNS